MSLPAGSSSASTGLRQRKRRTREVEEEGGEERVELMLLPNTAGAKTDAQIRIFLQDRLALLLRDRFDDPELTQKIQEEVDKIDGELSHLQLELDLNLERSSTEEHKLDKALVAERVTKFVSRVNAFLRSLKYREDAENAATAKLSRLEDQVVPSPQAIDDSELPANVVEHLMNWGMEKHLEVVKKYLLGSEEALGITLTFKDLTVTQQRPRARGQCFRKQPSQQAQSPSVELLKHLYGVIPAGRLTLLLGAPHSGKTQLLHALSRHTKNKGPITLTGQVFYNSHSFRDVHPSNFCTVAEQTDVHIPVLTVRETLEFAHQCRNRSNNSSPEMKKKSKSLLKNRVDLIMAVLGLTRVADTIVGNENLKGISGGEMRRVTLGEMLVAGSKVLLLDEVSTGLDSAATFDITKSILSMCKVLNVSSVISLLQPPPETFDLFQDLILMSDGHILYHGERAKALEYMNALGREMPRVMDVADFLIETSLDRTPLLLEAYKQTTQYQAALEADPASTQYANSPAQQAREKFLVESPQYVFSYPYLLRVVIRRQMMIMLRNKPFILARITQNIVMGLLTGALFFQIPFSQYYLIAMVLSQGLSLSGMSTMALLGDVLTVRNTFYKQSRENFFPPITYVLADYVVGLPFSLMDAFLLGTISYFMAGLSVSNNGSPYFVFLVLFISFGVCMATIIRFFGYVARDQSVASSIGVFFNIMALVFGGAIATPNVIPGWWIWYYWAFSPFAWVYRSLLQNELLSDKYQAECASGCPNNLNGSCLDYCIEPPCLPPYPEMTCGEYFLRARQVETNPMFLWLGAGLLWIYTVVFIGFSTLALLYVRHDTQYAELNADFEVAKPIKDKNEETEPQADLEAGSAQHEEEPPPTLAWRNLFYTIQVRAQDEQYGERRVIDVDLLKGISGFAKPYEMTALMGSSGAGKTTLLDCLCYRKTMGHIKGEILLNGVQVEPKLFKKQVGYVEQFGIHNPKSTVRESLVFSARLRLPNGTSDEIRHKIVDTVTSLLQVGPIAHQRCDTLSFEENKRLTIAVELCAKAKLVFADEPTSGLTSKEANLTMTALDRVAKFGVPVICTIHQPSSEIFQKFTRLLLLKRGGEIVYFGHVSRLVAYFEAVPEAPRLPNGLNPATWMLDVIGAGVGRNTNTGSNQLDYAEVYRMSDQCRENEDEMESTLKACSSIHRASVAADEQVVDLPKRAVELEQVPAEFNSSYQVQFKYLLIRNFQDFWRTPTYSHLRWVIILFFAFVTGTLFLQQDLSTAAGVQSRVSVINLMLLLTANFNAMVCIPFNFERRALFYREKSSGMYSSILYAYTYQLTEEPYILWEVVVSTCVFYFAIGMTASASAFFYYLFLLYFFVLSMTFLGATIAAGTGMQGAATLITSLVIQLLVLFSGVAVPGNLLASWLLGGYYISPVRWAMEGLVVSQFTTYDSVICNPSSQVFTWLNGSATPSECVASTINYLGDVNKNACCNVLGNLPISALAYTLTGWEYPDGTVTPAWLGGNNGYRIDWMGYDYLYVIMTMIILRICHVLFIQFVSHQKR
ncbi:hypothetical protein BASA81_003079 [Batrachochytrium salamandrivorans]|nr:hypothetical protein BASA81_003079 [Batrachochytrium salamandrivorans]